MNDISIPYFRVFAAQWLASTSFLSMTPADRGGLFMLLLLDWLDNGIPDDDQRLSELSGLDDAWFNGSAQMIRPYFAPLRIKPGYISNPTLQSERQRYMNWVSGSQKGGQKSGQKHKGNSKFGSELAAKRWMRSPCEGPCEGDANQLSSSLCTEKEKGAEPSRPSISEVNIPSLEEVLVWGQMDGFTPEQCQAYFDHQTSMGWMYGNTPIRNPRVWLKRWVEKARRPGGGAKRTGAATAFEKKTRLDQLVKLYEEHPAAPNANYSDPPTAEERAEYRKIVEEIKNLRREIAQLT